MSQMHLGTGTVDLRVENEQLKAQLAASNAALDEFKKKSEGGTEETVKGFRKSIAAVTGFIASLTAAMGVATTFFVLGQKIRAVWDDFFTSGTEKAKAFADAISSVAPDAVISQTQARITELQAQLDTILKIPASLQTALASSSAGGLLGKLLLGDQGTIQAELDALTKKLTNALAQAHAAEENAKKIRENAEAEKKAAEEKKKADREAIEATKERLKADEEYWEEIAEMQGRFNAMRRKAHEEEMERIQEESDRRMEELEKWEREYNRITQAQSEGFGPYSHANFANLGRLADGIQSLNKKTGRG